MSDDFWGKGAGDPSSGPTRDTGLRDVSHQPAPTFYAKEGGDPAAPAQEGGFWSKAEDKKKRKEDEAEALRANPDGPRERRRRRFKIALFSAAGGLVAALVLCVALAPNIAGALAPGFIAGLSGTTIAGRVSAASVDLSWSGPQRVTGFTLSESDGKRVAKATVETSASFLSLVRRKLDLGDVTISAASVDFVRRSDGTTNLASAIAPPKGKGAATAGSSPSRPAVPADLAAKVRIRNLDLAYTDQSRADVPGGVVQVRDADIDAEISPARPMKATFEARVFAGDEPPASGGGLVELEVEVKDWRRADGILTTDDAVGTVGLVAREVPTSILDALIGPRGDAATYAASLGPEIELDVKANGNLKALSAEIVAKSRHARIAGTVELVDNAIRVAKPVEVFASGTAIGGLVPGAGASLAADADARLDGLPAITLTLESLRFPMPAPDGSLDFRGAAAAARLSIAEAAGVVTLQPGQPAKRFLIAPTVIDIASADLAGQARVSASTSATIGGEPAGNLDVNLTLGGLLARNGAFVTGLPGSVQGNVTLRSIATAIAQPFVEPWGLRLTEDVGPTLDLSIVAASTGGADGPISLDLAVESRHVRASGGVNLLPDSLAAKPQGITVSVASAGAIASRLISPDTGWQVTPDTVDAPAGAASLRIDSLTIPRGEDGLVLHQALVRGEARVEGMALASIDAGGALAAGEPIRVRSLTTRVNVKAGGDASVSLDAAAEHEGAPFTIRASMSAPKVVVRDPAGGPGAALAPLLSLRPEGSIDIAGAPASLATMFVRPVAAGSNDLDVASLIRDALGGGCDVAVETKASAEIAGALDVRATAKSPRFSADARADITPEAVTLRPAVATTSIAPKTIATLLRTFAPSVAGEGDAGLRLVSPASLRVSIDETVIPLDKDYRPRLERVGIVGVDVGIAGQTLVDGLTLPREDGTPRPIGPIGVKDLSVRSRIPVGAFCGTVLPDQRSLRVSLTGSVIGADAKPIAKVEGVVTGAISDALIDGSVGVDLRLDQVSARGVERLLGRDGSLTTLLGEEAGLRLAVMLSTPPNSAPAALGEADIDADVSLTAPRLESQGPVRVRVRRDRVALAEPAKLTISPDPASLTRLLAGPSGGKGLRATSLSQVFVTLDALSLPRAGASPVGPRPVILATLTSAGGEFVGADDKPIRVGQVLVNVATHTPAPGREPPAGDPVNFRLRIAEAAVGETAANDMALEGSVTNLFGPDGSVDASRALLTLHADMPAIPTALVDAALSQDGMLVEGLGPAVALKVDADRVPLGDGARTTGPTPTLLLRATSDRAQATVQGTFSGAVFRSTEPVRVSVAEITRLFARRFIQVAPLLGFVEKTREDAPALLTATNFTAPLGSDLSQLNGDVTIEPGQCRFETSGLFSRVLKSATAPTSGAAGTRLEPLHLTVRSGVVTYPKWTVPLGEFPIELQANQDVGAGGIDLVKKTVDVVIWIPAGALADEALGQLRTGLGGILSRTPVVDALTLTPWRVRGTFEDARPKFDADLWTKSAIRKLNPAGALKDLLNPK